MCVFHPQAGAKEPLKTYESDHQMATPVGAVGLDPQEFQAYQQKVQQHVSSDTTTTTSSGKTMPQSIFEKFHHGMTATEWAAEVAKQKQAETQAATVVAAQIAAQPAAAPKPAPSKKKSPPSSSSESTSSTTTTSGQTEPLKLFEAQHQIPLGFVGGGSVGLDPEQWQNYQQYTSSEFNKMVDYAQQQVQQDKQQGLPTTTSSETTTSTSSGKQVKVPIAIYEQFNNGMDPNQVAQQQAQLDNVVQQDVNQVQQELANPPTSSTSSEKYTTTETTTTSGQVEPLQLFEAEHMWWSPSGMGGVGLDPKEYQAYLASEASEEQKEQDYIQKYQVRCILRKLLFILV